MIEIEVRKDRHRLETEKYGERTLKENVDKLTNALLLICSLQAAAKSPKHGQHPLMRASSSNAVSTTDKGAWRNCL